MIDIKTIPVRFSDWKRTALSNTLFVRGIFGILAVVIADQASKYWVVDIINLPERRQIDLTGIFDLTFVRNYGASFGIFNDGGVASRVFLATISIGVSVFLIGWLGRLTRPAAAIGVALIVGGALGNVYDRISLGYVIDFLDFSGLWFPWVFNVADSAINVGVACLIYDAFTTKDAPA